MREAEVLRLINWYVDHRIALVRAEARGAAANWMGGSLYEGLTKAEIYRL